MRLQFPFFLLLSFTFTFFGVSSKAQVGNKKTASNKYTINGFVKDQFSGESLIGANVTIDGNAKGVITNAYGFYSITLPEVSHTIVTSFIGYLSSVNTLQLRVDTSINIFLNAGKNLSKEVVVTTKKRENNVKVAQMGKISLPIEQIKSIPAFLGEVDLLKTVQLLPGVKNAGEGNAGIYVRGGGPDQNLILLDDAVVYNTGHLFGFFSIFNSPCIRILNKQKNLLSVF
jgi:hypothetical protein